ncbi:hypothetical protein GCM10011386_34200 [Parapedobacter defluvii]|uniref:DUF4959 domain-containing protein n=1 Tax=Parapedobacter defluvii TaxID=2045106 RepID=A0ABQ1MEB3_9SPHI|nr:DUF4959 domain-containing protein [Parapedobacter defluvii]RQP19852.1 MAG: DUF4959 domain-containing protein [Parapedobacter sp.]GGC39282.1 hypothetical protein GCM10011386_34200 [Parapedobacter defluvii]
MKKLLNISCYILASSFVWSCSDVRDWSDPVDKEAPGVVRDVAVRNVNGGAVISYTLPDDDDLLGVKAVYVLNDGVPREIYSSAFKDSITLEGYADTEAFSVSLYAVDKSKNESLPVEVTINPLTPPIKLIRETLDISPTFGGVFATWDNPLNKEISVTLYNRTPGGELTVFDTYYSNASRGRYTFRGLTSEPQDLVVELRDRWNNFARPLDTVLTPLFETEILGRDERGGMIWTQWGYNEGTHLFRGDMHRLISNRTIANATDGELMSGSVYWHCSNNMLSDFMPGQPEVNTFPYYFTIDMGRKASYSRLAMWMRDRSPLFSAELPSVFEIWATNEPKPISEIGNGSREDNLKYWTEWPAAGGTDAWKNDWVKIADCVMQLPSGTMSPSELTNEDRDYIRSGFVYDIDTEQAGKPYRYLRFVVHKTNTGVPQFMISELKFWGAYAD